MIHDPGKFIGQWESVQPGYHGCGWLEESLFITTVTFIDDACTVSELMCMYKIGIAICCYIFFLVLFLASMFACPELNFGMRMRPYQRVKNLMQFHDIIGFITILTLILDAGTVFDIMCMHKIGIAICCYIFLLYCFIASMYVCHYVNVGMRMRMLFFQVYMALTAKLQAQLFHAQVLSLSLHASQHRQDYRGAATLTRKRWKMSVFVGQAMKRFLLCCNRCRQLPRFSVSKFYVSGFQFHWS